MHIIFDLDDTLYKIQPLFERAIKESFPDFQIEDYSQLYKDFRRVGDKLFEASKASEAALAKMHVDRISLALKEYDYHIDEEMANNFHNKYQSLQFNNKLDASVEETLNYLIAKGFTLGLITNGDSHRQREKIKSLELAKYFADRIIVSGDYNYAKPDPRIFKNMEAICNGQAFIYVGDSLVNDIEGAKAAGWESIWISNHEQADIKAISELKSRY